MPSQLHFGPFLCRYGISLCNPDYDYEPILDELWYLTRSYRTVSTGPVSRGIFYIKDYRERKYQRLLEKFSKVKVCKLCDCKGCNTSSIIWNVSYNLT